MPLRPAHYRNRACRMSIALWAGLCLAGCSGLGPPTALPAIALPTHWQNHTAQTPTDLASWWLRFDDAQLTRLVGDALAANPGVAGARAALRQARALRDVAQAALYPGLNASFSASQNRSDDRHTEAFNAGLDASWEVDVFGATRSTLRAGDAAASASAASLGAVQVSVAAEVALDYINLRSAQERLAIAQSNLAVQQDTLQIADWRRQAGLVTALETEQAIAARAQTQALLPALQTAIDQNAHALAVLTGRTPEALLEVLAPVVQVPQPATDIAFSFPAETLRQRADVRSAEFQVQAAAERVSAAEAARLPSFKLGGSLGLNALTLAGLGSGATVLSSLLASVSMPLFDGGANAARVGAQGAALEQTRTDYQASVLRALQEVEDALVALRGDRLRLASLRQAAASSVTAAELAGQRFQSGLVDFQTVLDTQRSRLSNQDSVASAYAALSADHVRLYKALGGGWQSETKAPP
jgi:NodT family efflux transporter outer membrane factor (OMF) lipoprotein